ncbi:alpha/beta hydrolase [Actinomadura sp. DC4]|uniref:alpha/beta fold hydrolase n=1 Tax=Actinomadura sp. DC4 TaxID=3055069 RepID=UPI0025B1335A|nr:alpha/beta hydrolase [Actinomadura sp. DC4]MDN3359129.1 alpha/beta hydrolase [Actinomadura sp. DC4]
MEESGEPKGRPVFLLHGTPGCRLGPRPRPIVLYQSGVRLIAFDRPGYGESDRKSGRTVADAAADVAAIADALGLRRFAVLGRSGGGPHALACAALLPGRVTKAAALVPLAPHGADGLDWFAGMTASNVAEFSAARRSVSVVAGRLGPAAERIREDPGSHLAGLLDELTDADRKIIGDVGIRRLLVSNFAEGLRSSAAGWVDDVIALVTPWGFDPGTISRPTLVWHGAEDRFSPAGHAAWLGERIPGARLILHPGGSHFSALDVLPRLLPWLVESRRNGSA